MFTEKSRHAWTRALAALLVLSATACGVSGGYSGSADNYQYSVYVASATTGSISQFLLKPRLGRLALQSTTAGSAGTISLAIHPSGSFLYAVEQGNGSSGQGGILIYSVDPVTGALTAAPASAAAGSGLSNPRGLAFDASGTHLYTADFGANQLVSFRVDPSSGALSSKATVAASGAPTDLRVDPSGRRLVAPRFADDKVSVYSIAADGSLTLATQVYTGNPATSSQAMGPSSTLFSRDGATLFVANSTAGSITRFAFDAAAGTLTYVAQAASAQATDTPSALLTDPSSAFLYALSGALGTITQYASAAGALTAGASSVIDNPSAAWLDDTTGDFLFVAQNGGLNSVTAFRRDLSTGRLTATDQISTGANPQAVVARRLGLGI